MFGASEEQKPSLYVRAPGVPPVRIGGYPKRRPALSETEARLAIEAVHATAATNDPSYLDLIVDASIVEDRDESAG